MGVTASRVMLLSAVAVLLASTTAATIVSAAAAVDDTWPTIVPKSSLGSWVTHDSFDPWTSM